MRHEVNPAGWYPDPELIGMPNHLRYWNGAEWTEHRRVRGQKSAGVATVLTILWPGAGHLYLGLNSKGMPFFVWNAVLLMLVLLSCELAIPVGVVVWIVTLCMTIGSIAADTEAVNNGDLR